MCTVITDTTQYLDFPSCHASNTKRNISFNLGRRNCSIALDPGLHSKRLEELKAYPIKQHYHEILLMLSSINRWTYILRNLGKTKPKENQNSDNKPFAITHNPRSHNILRAVNQFSPVLEQLNNMKLSDFINSRWQAPNLKKLLTTSKFTSSWERVWRPAMWNMCSFGRGRGKTLKSDNRLNPNASIDCKTQNVIYCLNVKLCQLWWQ